MNLEKIKPFNLGILYNRDDDLVKDVMKDAANELNRVVFEINEFIEELNNNEH